MSERLDKIEDMPRLRLLTIEELMELTGEARRTIEVKAREGSFPKPIKIGRKRKWRAITIIKHLEAKDRKAGNL